MNREQIIERFKRNQVAQDIGLNASGLMFVGVCLDQWEQPHRFYHGLNHLSNILEQIDNLPVTDSFWFICEKEKMEILALFHDVIYDPRRKDNEKASIKFIKGCRSIDFSHEAMKQIIEGINYTEYDENFMDLGADNFIRMFCQMDIGCDCMDYEGEDGVKIAQREIAMFKEFQFVNFPLYKEKRIEFIRNFKYFSQKFKDCTINFLSNYRPKIGVYPGSFNPLSIGHMNIIEQAEKVFDKVIIAVGKNPDKAVNRTDIHTPERILPFHQVVYFDGLLSDYLKTIDYADVTVIRGLRSGYDLDYEMQQLRILEDYGCKLPVAYFLCSKETTHISSSMIRGLSKFGNGQPKKYIPNKYSYAN